jgi:hypothetical protein
MRERAEQRVRELEAQVEAMIERRASVIRELRDLADDLDEAVVADVRDRDPSPVPARADDTG